MALLLPWAWHSTLRALPSPTGAPASGSGYLTPPGVAGAGTEGAHVPSSGSGSRPLQGQGGVFRTSLRTWRQRLNLLVGDAPT